MSKDAKKEMNSKLKSEKIVKFISHKYDHKMIYYYHTND